MTYRVQLHTEALNQMGNLPESALTQLLRTMAHLADNPWDAIFADGSGKSAHRLSIFGEIGMVEFQLDEPNQVLWIHKVVWAG